MKKLSIIIVSYLTCEILEDCLKNLHNIVAHTIDVEIIVVDNDSSDGSADMVAEKFKDVILIRSQNKGLAAGSNKGLEVATGEFILYLGSDAFPERDTIKGMLDYMTLNPSVGVSTCKLVTRDGNLDMDAHRGFPTPWASITHFTRINKLFPKSSLFNQYFLGNKNFNKPHEIDLCISHFMLIRHEVFTKIGNWDEDFFLFGEDVDFCYRVKQAGYKIMYLPQWTALHYKGASVGTRKTTQDVAKTPKAWRKKMRIQTVTSMKLFYDKHYKNKYPWYITGFVLMAVNVLGLFRRLKD